MKDEDFIREEVLQIQTLPAQQTEAKEEISGLDRFMKLLLLLLLLIILLSVKESKRWRQRQKEMEDMLKSGR